MTVPPKALAASSSARPGFATRRGARDQAMFALRRQGRTRCQATGTATKRSPPLASEMSSSTDFRPDFFTAAIRATTSCGIVHPLLGDFDDDVAGLHVLLRRGAVRIDLGDHHALDALADMELSAELVGERRDGKAKQFLMVGFTLRPALVSRFRLGLRLPRPSRPPGEPSDGDM